MAASSSLFSCSMHTGVPSLKISTCSKDFLWCHSKVSCKPSSYLKSTLRRDGIHCQALEIEHATSFSVGQKFQLDDVIEAQQFDRDILNAIFEVALDMENIEKNSPGSQLLKGYLMATLFYEPSTRTRLSFESAMKRLGGEVLTTENAREFSSAAKGETLEDTIRTVEGYSDIIVMRHFESGAARRAAATAGIPIINAGDGPGQHPTQENCWLNQLYIRESVCFPAQWKTVMILKKLSDITSLSCYCSYHLVDDMRIIAISPLTFEGEITGE